MNNPFGLQWRRQDLKLYVVVIARGPLRQIYNTT